ncbi:MAG: leucine-rich repeat domain-containing protein [Treponema sp.]|nr:leucine-rich repeat domain-containing protein [Treponema sp.]
MKTLRILSMAALALTLPGILSFGQDITDFRVLLTSDGTGVVITRYTGTETHVKIPAELEGFPVKEIAKDVFGGGAIKSALGSKTGITGVELPPALLKIGEGAFANSGISSITIPDSVIVIGKGAFKGSALVSVTLGKGVVSLAESAFSGCKSLKTVTFAEGLTEISSAAFLSCDALEELNFPSTIRKIGSSAFSLCGSLHTVRIPDSVEIIEMSGGLLAPFKGCSKMNLASQAALKRRGYMGTF